MIVSRRFIPFLQLYRTDPLSAKVLEKGFWIDPEHDNEENRRIWQGNYNTRVTNAEMGCCIPDFPYIVEKFRELDKTNPYDTGYGIDDVTNVEILEIYEGKIHLALMGPYNTIAGIATLMDGSCTPHNNYPKGHFCSLDKYVVVD